jgi:hypothetical protein
MPNTSYVINAHNNKLYLKEGSDAEIELTLTNGNYDNDTFPVLLNEVLDAGATQSYTVLLSPSTFKLTISAIATFGFNFANKNNNSHALMGFANEDSAQATSLTGSHMINLSPIHMFNISLDGISGIDQRNLHSTTFVVPVPAGALQYVNYQSNVNFDQIIEIHSDKRVITMTILNEQHQLLDLNGVDWMLILEKLN